MQTEGASWLIFVLFLIKLNPFVISSILTFQPNFRIVSLDYSLNSTLLREEFNSWEVRVRTFGSYNIYSKS